MNVWDYPLDPPPGSGHGPMKTDPAYPYNSQIQNGGLFRDGELTVSIIAEHEGPDPEALGRQADTGNQR